MATHRAAMLFLCMYGLVEKPINEVYGFILLAVNDFGVYLSHSHIGMAKQLTRSIEVGSQSEHHCRKSMTGGVERKILRYTGILCPRLE